MAAPNQPWQSTSGVLALTDGKDTRNSMKRTVDGYLVHPEPVIAMQRQFRPTALSAIGGSLPVNVHEFARRAYLYALDPLRNPVKEVMDAFSSVRQMPPMLGIFNDIPADKMREDEVMNW